MCKVCLNLLKWIGFLALGHTALQPLFVEEKWRFRVNTMWSHCCCLWFVFWKMLLRQLGGSSMPASLDQFNYSELNTEIVFFHTDKKLVFVSVVSSLKSSRGDGFYTLDQKNQFSLLHSLQHASEPTPHDCHWHNCFVCKLTTTKFFFKQLACV